jgi:phosphomannomutase
VAALMVSISGIRGIVGESLTPQVIQKYTLAFGTHLNHQKVIVGGDSRTSGTYIRNLVKGCLEATGCDVIDIGIVPTPTVQMEILHHQAAGGVAITASHNPPEWNGLKFMDANGRFLNPAKAEQIYRAADEGQVVYQSWTKIGKEWVDPDANHRHIEAILRLPFVEVNKIRKRKFKVIVDCVNGAGGLIIPDLLTELGCEIQVLNGEANGHFAHTPEPLPENLGELCSQVKKIKADIGFAVDPDVDRCAIIDNTGSPIGEEYTLALAVKFILMKKLGPVVVNMSSSRASEDITRYYNCRFIRTRVGEINVAEEMAREEAVIGGEGNGGVILPDLHLGRDAPLAVVLTLQFLLESGKTMRDLFLSLPQYKIVKAKINIEGLDPDNLLEKITLAHEDQPINNLDGIKIDTDNTWVHLRKSNTEPIIRIMAEAPTEKEAQQLVDQYLKEIKGLIQ